MAHADRSVHFSNDHGRQRVAATRRDSQAISTDILEFRARVLIIQRQRAPGESDADPARFGPFSSCDRASLLQVASDAPARESLWSEGGQLVVIMRLR